MSRYKRINTPLTLVPPQNAAIPSLNISDGKVAETCNICGEEVARYDATGRAWCVEHFYGCIRFTVASHHWQDLALWADDPNAFTIMAGPPKSWPRERNIDIFAAEWETVNAYRKKEITEAQYTQQFSSLMQERLPKIKAWLREHDGQHITLLCACNATSLATGFCHRFLVAKLLVWLGCYEEAWEPVQRVRAA